MSPRERTIAIATSLVIGALAVDRVFLSPLMARRATAQVQIDDATTALSAAQTLFRREIRDRRRLTEMAGDSVMEAAPQAEGQVLNGVREWAQQAGVELSSIKPERSEQRQGYGLITIRAAGTGGMGEIAQFLYAMETADVPLRVVDVSITARREGTDELSVQVGLATIYLPPGEPAAQANTAVRTEAGR